MAPRKKRVCLYDSAIDVRAGYPGNKFFPEYNGKQTVYADLLNRIEQIQEGEGILMDVPEGDNTTKFISNFRSNILIKYNLRPLQGFRWKLQITPATRNGTTKVLLTIGKIPPKKPRKKKAKPLIFVDENRTEDQIALDRAQAKKDADRYEVNLRKARRQRMLEDEEYRKKQEAKAAEKLARKKANDAKWDARRVGAKDRKDQKRAEAREENQRIFDAKVLDMQAKEARLARRARVKSTNALEALRVKKEREKGEES